MRYPVNVPSVGAVHVNATPSSTTATRSPGAPSGSTYFTRATLDIVPALASFNAFTRYTYLIPSSTSRSTYSVAVLPVSGTCSTNFLLAPPTCRRKMRYPVTTLPSGAIQLRETPPFVTDAVRSVGAFGLAGAAPSTPATGPPYQMISAAPSITVRIMAVVITLDRPFLINILLLLQFYSNLTPACSHTNTPMSRLVMPPLQFVATSPIAQVNPTSQARAWFIRPSSHRPLANAAHFPAPDDLALD